MIDLNKKNCFIIITPGFPESEKDTICLPYLQKFVLAHLQINSSIDLIVLSFQYPFTSKEYKWHGVKIIPFNGANSKNPFTRLLLWFKVWQKLKSIHEAYKIVGIFNQWLTECSLIGLKFGRKYKIEAKSWLIGQDSNKTNKYIKLINPKPSEIISMSEELCERLEKNHGLTSNFIAYNGIDENDFILLKQQERDIDIIGVSSLIQLKRVDQWVDIIYALSRSHKNLKCVIIGDGILKDEIINKIKFFNLEANISVMGYLPHKETLEYMNRSKILLHCSHSEGNSTVFSEALRCGCFVVSYKVGFVYNIPKHVIGKHKDELQLHCQTILNSNMIDHKYQKVNSMVDSYLKIMEIFTAK